MTIGCIQDILLGQCVHNFFFQSLFIAMMQSYADDKFISLQNKFLEDHYHHFEDTEENKLIYMDIFKKYVSAMLTFDPWVKYCVYVD